MNQVIYTLEDLGYPVYYTDTDYMQVSREGVKALQIEFPKRYPNYGQRYRREDAEIVGKNLGQFHIDFEPLSKVEPRWKEIDDPNSTSLTCIEKKMYCNIVRHTLQHKNNPKLLIYVDCPHVRFRGVPRDI